MNVQQLHIIDTALEVLMHSTVYQQGLANCTPAEQRRLKNAVYDCIRCFYGGEVWGEPSASFYAYECWLEMVEVNIATLSAILMEMGFPLEKT